jgi:glycosyltransferase involved in cell wall biosynthesis
VHRFLANSNHVAGRIRRYYNRQATTVYPPVDTAFYQPDSSAPGSHFLIVSALVPYKRIDVAIDACARAGADLRIIGDGPGREELERRAAKHTNVRIDFLGWQPPERIRTEYCEAAAVLLPGEEDFGIVPVEAQACGRPVVALARGGALETVVDGDTGVLVAVPLDQAVTGEAFAAGLERLGATHFDPERMRANALRFSRELHIERMKHVIDDTLAAPVGQRW